MRPVAFSEALLERLSVARNVAVLTGAGISAESGVPTFRDPGGLWERFRPEELASMDGFLSNPSLVQEWYAHRREVIENVRPNAGHHALVDLGRMVTSRGGRFVLATQNVDGLHARAGSGARECGALLELHGNLTRTYCMDCGREAGDDVLAAVVEGRPARCPACGGLLRPDVVWFGEILPETALQEATRAAEAADVYLSVGTSAAVYPAAGLPLLAGACGAYVVEINPTPSDIAGRVDEVIAARAGVALPQLVARLGLTT